MDRRITPPSRARQILVLLAAGAAVAAGVAALLAYLGTPRLRVERDKLTLEPVRHGTFQEYLLVPGALVTGPAGPEVRARVDRDDLPRLAQRQGGSTEIGGRRYDLEVTAAEAVPGRDAAVTLRFTDSVPEGVPSEPALHVRLDLGAPVAALLLARGSFFQATGGRWAWVVDEGGDRAHKRPIRLGRQNPEVHEVLGGLAAGEVVITSTYDHLEGVEELVLIP